MLSITDKERQPTFAELSEYIGNPLFDELCAHMAARYGAAYEVMYSGDKVLLGWNLRLYKGGRTLCRLYPREGRFAVLLVVGRREKPRVEALPPEMSEELRGIYERTGEGMGQRWLLLELCRRDALYEDLLSLVDIRAKK